MSKDQAAVLWSILFIGLLVSCTTEPASTPGVANPASVYCEENGGTLEIRTADDGSQYGMCLFPDGSECDEWAFFRGECSPTMESEATPLPTNEPMASPTDLPTPIPVDRADTEGWWTYANNEFTFSLRLPLDWVAEEITTSDPLMNGHLINIHPQDVHPDDASDNVNLRVTFRRLGEEVLLWPTGVGSGELVPQGVLDVAGAPVRRILFLCPTGQVNAIYYQGQDEANVRRAGVEFGFIFSFTGVYCEEGYSLGGEVQHVAETILASLDVGE